MVNIIEELTDELLLFYNSFASWESSVIRSGEFSVSEAHALETLGQHGTMNMKSLAQKLGVTTGTTTITVDRLESKNYAKQGLYPNLFYLPGMPWRFVHWLFRQMSPPSQPGLEIAVFNDTINNKFSCIDGNCKAKTFHISAGGFGIDDPDKLAIEIK